METNCVWLRSPITMRWLPAVARCCLHTLHTLHTRHSLALNLSRDAREKIRVTMRAQSEWVWRYVHSNCWHTKWKRNTLYTETKCYVSSSSSSLERRKQCETCFGSISRHSHEANNVVICFCVLLLCFYRCVQLCARIWSLEHLRTHTSTLDMNGKWERKEREEEEDGKRYNMTACTVQHRYWRSNGPTDDMNEHFYYLLNRRELRCA